jgi:hypothetical protein
MPKGSRKKNTGGTKVVPLATRTEKLADNERRDFKRLEATVERGLATFKEVGSALAAIRDRRLYRETHGNFEDYLHERWDLVRSRGYQLIDAARVSTIVDNAGLPIPANEAQARELVPVLRQDEQQVVDVWQKLRAEYGDDVTAERVHEMVSTQLKRKKRKQEKQAAPPDFDSKKQVAHVPGQRDFAGKEPPAKPEPLEELRLAYPRTKHAELLKALDLLGREWTPKSAACALSAADIVYRAVADEVAAQVQERKHQEHERHVKELIRADKEGRKQEKKS